MTDWLRIGAWTLFGLILLWVVLEVVSVVLGFVSWVISTIVSLLVVAILLYLAYLGLSRLTGSKRTGASKNRLR